MNDFMTGYLLGRKKERRRIAQASMPLQPGRPWVTLTARGLRRLALLLVVLVGVLVLLFLAFCVVYGVQHHLIYPMPRRSSGR